ncbi:MAG: hypothetical protein QME40_06895 [bacterium]|nr:hypothetical protein [bacterium]
MSEGKKIKVILLGEGPTDLTGQGEDSKPWNKLEELGEKIARSWKSERHSWQLISEGRR